MSKFEFGEQHQHCERRPEPEHPTRICVAPLRVVLWNLLVQRRRNRQHKYQYKQKKQ